MKGWKRKHIKKENVVGDLPEPYSLFKKMLSDKFGAPESEHQFHPTRKWRMDFAYPNILIGIEIEGLVYDGGISRHTNNEGYKEDARKYNSAAVLGWLILRFTPDQLNKTETFEIIKQAFSLRESQK